PRHLLHRDRLLVLVHGADGGGSIAERTPHHPNWRRRLRSAVLSGEQPDSRHVVSSKRTRARERDLLGGTVCGPRLPERAAVLVHAAVRLALAVRRRRRLRHAL